VEGGLLLDVVVRKSAAILELLSGEDQTLPATAIVMAKWEAIEAAMAAQSL
jgi:hypothetical protein